MDIGKMRMRIQLQSLLPAQDATTGIITPTWVNFGGEIWASVEPLTTREFIAAADSNSSVTLKLTIRFQSGVLPSMRVLHGTHIYQVVGTLPDKTYGNQFLTLLASEVISG